MYVMGGLIAGDMYSTSVLKYDTREDTWSDVAPMPGGRWWPAACAVGSSIYVFGGFNSSVKDTVYRYDTEADEWSTLAPMPEARDGHSVSVLDGMVYVLGGEDDNEDALRSVLPCASTPPRARGARWRPCRRHAMDVRRSCWEGASTRRAAKLTTSSRA